MQLCLKIMVPRKWDETWRAIMLNWVRIGLHEIYDGYLLAYHILNLAGSE